MLCSERELGWGKDHDGIVEQDPSLPLGQSLCDIANTSDIIDIKTPSNRWDYLSYIGLAREISATQADNSLVEPGIDEITYQDREAVKVKKDGQCQAFYLTHLKLEPNSASPRWLVDNLLSAGLRSVSAVVDITNFVMLEYGQPSHAYDAGKISGSFGVRFAGSKEMLTTLDGKDIELSSQDLVIVDNSGPIGLAGVIGGKSTETDPSSTEIWLEVADFDKTTVRRSALRHGIRTEASSRFERGLPASLAKIATARIIGLLKDICSAEVIDFPTQQLFDQSRSTKLGVRIRYAEKFLGIKLDEKEVTALLDKRGFDPSHFSISKELKALAEPNLGTDNSDAATIRELYSKAGIMLEPTLKQQFSSGMEVPEASLKPGDVLFLSASTAKKSKNNPQQAGIYIGKSKIQGLLGSPKVLPITHFTKSPQYLGARRYAENFNHIISVDVPWWRRDVVIEADIIEEIAKGLGYENLPASLPTIQLTNTTDHQLLPQLMELREKLAALGLIEVMTYSFVSKSDIKNALDDKTKHLQIENPLSSEQDYLRTGIMSSHLRAASSNQSSAHDGIFEISRVYEQATTELTEKWVLGITIWNEQSLARLKGVIDSVFGWYRHDIEVSRITSNIYIRNRAGSLVGGFGHFGQLFPAILKKFAIAKELSFASINIDKLIEQANQPILRAIPSYQIVYRDITLELDESVLYQSIKIILAAGLFSVQYKSEYQNDELKNSSKKRLTITIGIDLGPNPTSDEILQQLARSTKLVTTKLKAKLL
jgi:phenylalanyl-tRNA synthetase beta subunit